MDSKPSLNLLKVIAEAEENLNRKPMTWQEQIKAEKQIHENFVALFGEPKPGARTDVKPRSENDRGWSIEKTASKLGAAKSVIVEDIQLAQALKIMPELEKEKSKSVAKRKFKKFVDLQQRNQAPKNEYKNLILGNALTELKKMQGNNVDCVVIDPPYGVDFMPALGGAKIEGDDPGFFAYFEKVASELYRITKTDSHLYCFCGWGDSFWAFYSGLQKAGFEISNVLVWVKNTRCIGTDFSRKYAHLHEEIIFARKGKRYLNNDFSPDVLNFKVEVVLKHTTQKPLELLKYLIANSTLEGETVLDCFAGSGSTLVAAQQLKRAWIGIEIDSKFFEISKSRLTLERLV